MPAFTVDSKTSIKITVFLRKSKPTSARDIAKTLGIDKHTINQHLYKLKDIYTSSDDKVPLWTLINWGELVPGEDEDEDEDEENDDFEACCGDGCDGIQEEGSDYCEECLASMNE